MQLRLASGGEVHALLRAGGHRARILLLHGNPGSLADWSPLLRFGGELADIAAICWPRAIQSAWRLDATGLGEFARRYPERVVDVGIAEQHAVTAAAGLDGEAITSGVGE